MSQNPPVQPPASNPHQAAIGADDRTDPVSNGAGIRSSNATASVHSTIKSHPRTGGSQQPVPSGTRYVPGDPLPPKRPRNPSQASHSNSRQPKVGLVVTDLLKLRIALDQTQDLQGACQVFAEKICNLFECSNAFVSIESKGRMQLMGQESDGTLELEEGVIVSAQQEVSPDQTKMGWPESNYWQTSLVHKNLTNDTQPAAASFRVANPAGEELGAITVVGNKATCDAVSEKIDHVVELVVPHLCLRQQASESVFDRLRKSIKFKLFSGFKWVLAVGLLIFFFTFPIPHRIQCNTEAHPIARRYVSAPFDSVLKSTNVRAGDSVERDARLALLDEDEIRLRMSSSAAEQEKYRKQKSAALAKGETLAMQQAQLEYRRLSYKNDLLKQRSQNLEITSPISGIVLRSELEDAEGAPLTQGQVLFEIAPLDQMIFCVYISQKDIAYVEEGMEVTVTLDGTEKSFSGKIQRIRPQAITFESESVFVAEVEFDNSQGLVRPGMRGYATVVGQKQSIGWILFRKPLAYLKKLTGF